MICDYCNLEKDSGDYKSEEGEEICKECWDSEVSFLCPRCDKTCDPSVETYVNGLCKDCAREVNK